MNKQLTVALICLGSAITLTSSAIAVKTKCENDGFCCELKNGFTESAETVCDSVTELKDNLYMSTLTSDKSYTAYCLCNVSTCCTRASDALASFPYDNETAITVARKLSQLDEWSCNKVKDLSGGKELTAEDKKVLESFYNFAELLDDDLRLLRISVKNGKTDLSEMTGFSKTDEAETLSEAMSGWSEAMKSLPEIEYDGRFSDALPTSDMLFLTDKEPLSEFELAGTASFYCGDGCMTEKMKNGCYRSYGTAFAEYSDSGYLIKYLSEDREGKGMTEKEAEEKAVDFADRNGYYGLDFNKMTVSEETAYFVFDTTQDGIYCPADKITVGVSLKSGNVVFFSAEDYVKYHTERDLTFKNSEEDAIATLSENLTVTNCRKCAYMTDGGKETACYIINAVDVENGIETIITVNAETLMCENIITV